MRKFIVLWDRLEEYVAVSMVLLLVLFSICQVISRFNVIHFPLDWTEELSRYVFIALSYLAASLGIGQNRHVCVEAIDSFLPPRGRYLLQKAVWLIWGIFSLVVAHAGWVVTVEAFGTTTPVMEWDMGWLYMIIPVMFAIMAMRLFIKVLIENPLEPHKLVAE
jgi:TRAP-type C4-dicarboxylate transport system permease small subunit